MLNFKLWNISNDMWNYSQLSLCAMTESENKKQKKKPRCLYHCNNDIIFFFWIDEQAEQVEKKGNFDILIARTILFCCDLCFFLMESLLDTHCLSIVEQVYIF
jgi:hypothetical protein